MNGQTRHVVIIGAGIVGVSTAIWLLRDGASVTLIDRAAPGEATQTSFGNAGLLASAAIVPVTQPGLLRKAPAMLLDPRQPLFLKWSHLPRLMPWLIRHLSHAGAAETRRIAGALLPIVGDSLADHQALADGTGASKWISATDYLFVYRDRRAFAADAFGWQVRRENGWSWAEMEGRELRDYDPIFGPAAGFATRLGKHGRITDPGCYVRDLATHVEALGGRILKAEVTDIVRDNGRVTGVRAGGALIACDAAVLTGGAWSGPLARRLGLSVPLESERGYHLELWGPSAMPRSPAMIAAGKFLASPMQGRIRLAGIVEFGGLKAGPSEAPFALLERGIRAMMPGLTWKETRRWMGHRPTLPDSLPMIGAVPGAPGAWLGFGHQHVGLTGGPKTGRLLAQMIAGRRPNLDMSPYAPDRFSRRG